MQAYGFRPTGAKTPLSGVDVMEFIPPNEQEPGNAAAFAEYISLRGLIQFYQSFVIPRDAHDD